MGIPMYLLLRFQVLHRRVYQLQLLLRGTGQLLDGFQHLLGLELRQLLCKLLLCLLGLWENQKYFHGCPPFQSDFRVNLCAFSGVYVDVFHVNICTGVSGHPDA